MMEIEAGLLALFGRGL